MNRVPQKDMRHGDVVAYRGHAYRVETVEGTPSWWDPSTHAGIPPLEGAWIGRMADPGGKIGDCLGQAPVHPTSDTRWTPNPSPQPEPDSHTTYTRRLSVSTECIARK